MEYEWLIAIWFMWLGLLFIIAMVAKEIIKAIKENTKLHRDKFAFEAKIMLNDEYGKRGKL